MPSPSALGSSVVVAPSFIANSRRYLIGSIDDDLTGAGDTPGLHGSESDRSGTEDDDVGTGLEAHVGVAGGKSRGQLIAEERELRGRQIGEDRHAVFLEGRHDLAHAADAGLRVDRRAVEELRRTERNGSTPGAFEKKVN